MANIAGSDLGANIAGENRGMGADELDSQYEIYKRNLEKKYAKAIASEEALNRAKTLMQQGFWKSEFKNLENYEKGTKEYEDAKRANIEKTVELAQKLEENLFKYSTKEQKIAITERRKQTAQANAEDLKQRMATSEAELGERYAISKVAREQRTLLVKAGEEAIEAEKRRGALIRGTDVNSKQALMEKHSLLVESATLQREQNEENIKNIDEQIDALKERKKLSKDDNEKKEIDKDIAWLEANKASSQRELDDSRKAEAKEQMTANAIKGLSDGLTNGLKNIADKFGAAVDNAMDTLAQYRSGIEARLQGSQSSYDEFSSIMKKSLAVSPMVKQTEVLKKFDEAVDKGIAYNVEQRAFLGSISDKIATTFEAFDSNLMRIIRLQQADTTAARLGLEANLTQFFNSTFSDTSYLSEGYDSVSQALIDANAQMTRDMSISFEYNVQKWLGSLASLGFGTDTIQTIATGINYLGSGNVQALAGNAPLQSLLAMSASRSGLSYSEMLVNGIDDSSVNKLLKSMIEYLKEIAEDNNAVVKSAYGDIFDFSQADLRAIRNITASDISNIYKQSMSYDTATSEVNSQLKQVYSRLSTSEMIDNVFDNFLYTSAESIANNTVGAITWKLLSTIEDATGGVHLPAVSVMGNMIDLSQFTIEGLAKTGIFGISALSNLGNIVSSISNKGGLDLSAWGGTEYTSRGSEFRPSTGGVQSGVSSSKTITSSSSSDFKKESMSGADEDTDTMKKKSKESMGDQKTVEDVYDVTTLIYKRLSDVLPVRDSVVSKQLETIYTKLSGTINVKVTNIDKTPTTKFPSMIATRLVDTYGKEVPVNSKLSSMLTALESLSGTSSSSSYTSYRNRTLSDLINALLDGDVSVQVDGNVADDVKTIKNYLR